MSSFNRVFIDIDTQFDFMDPEGKLYVPGAERIVGSLEKLFSHAARRRIPVLSSMDDHMPDDIEFRQWPPHCVHGTAGQKKIPITLMTRLITLEPDAPLPNEPAQLLERYGQLLFPKPTLSVYDNPHFATVTNALGDAEFIVFGVATDYCVLQAAQGLLERGRKVNIVSDAIRAVTAETGKKACRTLTALGAKWVTTADVVGHAT